MKAESNPPAGVSVNLLCAGAVQGLARALQPQLLALTGAQLVARYGAVGALKEALLAGEPCDLMVVTDAMVNALAEAGALRADSRTPLGRVRTGIAVPSGCPRPAVATPEGLRAALLAATAIHFPDPERATAGIHFVKVLRELGIHDALAPRFRTAPSGAVAMRTMADEAAPGAIGCTQVTEILYTAGIELVDALPPAFELATVYSAAVATNAAQPQLAAHFIALLAGDAARALRTAGGFDA
jgi:molybdate transport system substrate-binding protein